MSSLWLLLFLACQEPELNSPVKKEVTSLEAMEQILEKGGVSSKLRFWPKEPVLGDILHLELQVTAKEGWEVEMPPFGEALGRFQIVDFEPSENIDSQNQLILKQKYRLQAHHSGKQLIPSLRVLVGEKDGVKQELLTDELSITIASVLPIDAPLELKPPRDKLTYFWSIPNEVWISGGIFLALGLGVLGVLLKRGKSKQVQISAFDKAIRALYALEESQYSEADLDQFYQELSMILRRYIEGRFGLPAPEQTTEEFLYSLEEVEGFQEDLQTFLRLFLRECDAIKFAGKSSSLQASREALGKVRQFIYDTRIEEIEKKGADRDD